MSLTEMAPPTADQETTGKSGGGRKVLLLGLLVVVGVAAAAWWFVFKPGPGHKPEPEPGEVVKLEAIQVNLAGGHYLRVGLALQTIEGHETELDGSRALDTAIELFTGEEIDKLIQPGYRNKLKAELLHELEEVYEGEVMDVYFTDFVTQ